MKYKSILSMDYALLWFVRLIPGLLLINWTIWILPPRPPRPAQPQVDLTSDERHLLMKQYETAVSEIRLRLEHEHHLFLLSFTIAGAVLGYGLGTYFFKGSLFRPEFEGAALENPKPSAAGQSGSMDKSSIRRSAETVLLLGCWGAVVAAAVIDLRRQFNADIIVQLGAWVQTVEETVYRPQVHGWETFIAKDSPLWNGALYPILRLEREALIWVLFVVAVQLFSTGSAPARTKQASYFGMQLSVLVFALIGIHYNYDSLPNTAVLVICAVVALIVTRYWYKRELALSNNTTPGSSASLSS